MANSSFGFPWPFQRSHPANAGYYRYPSAPASPSAHAAPHGEEEPAHSAPFMHASTGNDAASSGNLHPHSSTSSLHTSACYDSPRNGEPQPLTCDSVSKDGAADAVPDGQRDSSAESTAPACTALAAFREFYRSRDGLITVFEDLSGHFTSVDSSRLV